MKLRHPALIVAVYFLAIFVSPQPSAAVTPWAIEELAGKPAPQFSLPDMTGKKIDLNEFNGKVMLINFWATWCGPCRKEMPDLEKIQQKYQEKQFSVVAVSLDSDLGHVKAFLKRLPVTFPILHDPEMEVAEKYGVFAYPTSFLVDRKGGIKKYYIGEQHWLGKKFTDTLEILLNEK